MTVRTIRFLSLASVGGADQTALRSAASAATCPGERDGSDVEASCAAILVSISPTRVSALFHRNSSSAAISRGLPALSYQAKKPPAQGESWGRLTWSVCRGRPGTSLDVGLQSAD